MTLLPPVPRPGTTDPAAPEPGPTRWDYAFAAVMAAACGFMLIGLLLGW